MTSKYIAHFLEEVSAWVHKLSTTDAVLTMWLEVQRTWSHLESIFIGSEDIRAQLPEDSKRFDGIDIEFKGIHLNCYSFLPSLASDVGAVNYSLENVQFKTIPVGHTSKSFRLD